MLGIAAWRSAIALLPPPRPDSIAVAIILMARAQMFALLASAMLAVVAAQGTVPNVLSQWCVPLSPGHAYLFPAAYILSFGCLLLPARVRGVAVLFNSGS